MANGICDSYCKGCVYNQIAAGDYQTMCVYYLATDKRRPCPAGKGCTVRKEGRKYSRWDSMDLATWAMKMQEAKKAKAEVRRAVCPVCGTEFDTITKTRVYCSRRCREKIAQSKYYQKSCK